MATVLAIDSATGPCSAAVWQDGRIASFVLDERPVVQSARLLPMIEQALAEAKIGYSHLTAVACTVGPGSFTGIRVGLAAARGICFAANLPGIGFTTLEVLAHTAKHSGSVLALLNAGKGECYYQAFAGKSLFEPRIGPLDVALHDAPKNARLIGNIGAPEIFYPRANALAELAALNSSTLPLKPFYIRPPDAKPQVKNI